MIIASPIDLHAVSTAEFQILPMASIESTPLAVPSTLHYILLVCIVPLGAMLLIYSLIEYDFHFPRSVMLIILSIV